MNAKDEYEAFKEYFYFDYNVLTSIISFWNNLDNSTYQTSFCLYCILKEFYDLSKICIPYSMAHIWDVRNGEINYENKVKIINDISKGWYVSEDNIDDNLIRVDKCDDISQHFNDIYETMIIADDAQNIFNPLIEVMFKASVFNNPYSEKLDPDLYNMILDIYNEKIVKSTYDVFQFSYKLTNAMNIKNNINLNGISKEELINKMEILIKDCFLFSPMSFNSLFDYEQSIIKYTNNIQQSDFSRKIVVYSLLCDYIGITKEPKNKIYKDTFVSGMINDLLHLSIGLRCPIFVTNDKNMKIKAIICKILLGLNVRIFNIDNFYQYIINEYAKIKFPDENKKEFTIIMEINDKSFKKTLITNHEKIFYN